MLSKGVPGLDLFVVFSSILTAIGNPGEAHVVSSHCEGSLDSAPGVADAGVSLCQLIA